MYSKVTIIGHLGGDPEMRYLPSGNPVTNFSVATNYNWTDQDGEKHEQTTWFRVATWRGLAEVCNQYLSKGRQVFVEGEVRGEAIDGTQNPRVWSGNDGVARASFELTARTVKFLGGREDTAAGAPPVGEHVRAAGQYARL